MNIEGIDWGSANDYIKHVTRDRDRERWKALTEGSWNVKKPTIVVCRSKSQFDIFIADSKLENAVCVTSEAQLNGLNYRFCEFVLLDAPSWWNRDWHSYVTRKA